MRALLQDMQKCDVIRPSNSPLASPLCWYKRNGKLHFCVDYSVTRKEAYPLPCVDDTPDTLSGCHWFTTLDLVSGYCQVVLHTDDREKSSFTTIDGLFKFNVMPLGLCNAIAMFQDLMNSVLAGSQWTSCQVCVDDIIIPG